MTLIHRFLAGMTICALMVANVNLASAATSVFTDVPEGSTYSTALKYLKDKGIISGYPDGSFKPYNTVNRAESLKIILLGAGVTTGAAVTKNPFPDVATDTWFAPFIERAKSLAIVNGYPDGTFKPADTVNLAESMKMLLQANNEVVAGLQASADMYADVNPSAWYASYLQAAKNKGLIDADAQNKVYPANGMSRGALAVAMYRLMYIREKGILHFSSPSYVVTSANHQQVYAEIQANPDLVEKYYPEHYRRALGINGGQENTRGYGLAKDVNGAVIHAGSFESYIIDLYNTNYKFGFKSFSAWQQSGGKDFKLAVLEAAAADGGMAFNSK